MILNDLCTIYCLQLENEKYYVGRTGQKEFRIDSHSKGMGSQWTIKYPYEKI